MENLGFDHVESFTPLADSQRNVVQAHINMINATADVILPLSGWRSKLNKLWNNYTWRMRHYFYIHLSVFFCNTLLCGTIIWSVEKQQVPYVDCWFISATSVFTCGLQTYEFALFSRPSQIILLGFTFISGITISTLPAIFIKIYRVKQEINTAKEISSSLTGVNNDLSMRRLVHHDSILKNRLRSLPNAQQLRVTSYIILIVLILSTCFTIYLITFVAIGFWLKYQYDPNDLSSTNTTTINPFYASIVLTLTGFNQNGLSPWTGGVTRFVNDIFMNIVMMIVIMSGTSLFPAILRGVVDLFKYLSPWRYKIFFDYILLNNHRLSAVIFPSIQTRLYVTTTILMQILGVTVAMILDFNNPQVAMYGGGRRFMIFMFQTVNTRFGGYETIAIGRLAAGTLVIFILLMGVKPQMLCTINETPFEMEWVLLQTQQKLENKVSNGSRRASFEIFLPFHRIRNYLLRQDSITKAQAKKYFSTATRIDRAEAAIKQFTEKRYRHRLSIMSLEETNSNNAADELNTISNVHISLLRMRLFLIIFSRHVTLGLFDLLTSTRTWLFIFIFLICAFESPRVIPSNPTITVFRIIFEVISAFGGCGLSMGFTTKTPSLSAVLTVPSKIVIIFVMCMGRHRGLLDSMKDQEAIEYSAQTLIDSWRQLAVLEQDQKEKTITENQMPTTSIKVVTPTPPLVTRF